MKGVERIMILVNNQKKLRWDLKYQKIKKKKKMRKVLVKIIFIFFKYYLSYV